MRIRLRLWTARLGFEVRRNGGRLRVELGRGIHFESPPRIRALLKPMLGDRTPTTTVRIGDGADLGRDVTLEIWAQGENVLELGPSVTMNAVRIELRGGSVIVGEKSNIRDFTVLKSDGMLRIGSRVLVSFSCVLHCTEEIEIGDFCGLGEFVSVTDSDHAVDGSDVPYAQQPLVVEPVLLGRNVLVSRGSAVLRGATLAQNITVAANSVVTGSEHEPGWLIGGTPAKPIKQLAARPQAVDADALAS